MKTNTHSSKDAIKYFVIIIVLIITSLIFFIKIPIIRLEPFIRLGIFLLIIGLIFSLIPVLKFNWYKDEYRLLINYLVIVIVTTIGVFSAVHFNQEETQKSIKIEQEEILKIKRTEYENILQATKGNIFSCEPNPIEQSLLYDSNNFKKNRIYKLNLPVILANILTMDIVLENINQTTLEYLSFCDAILIKLYKYLNDSENFNNFKQVLNDYIMHLKISFTLLDNEIKRSQNKISIEDLKDSAKQLMPDYKIGY